LPNSRVSATPTIGTRLVTCCPTNSRRQNSPQVFVFVDLFPVLETAPAVRSDRLHSRWRLQQPAHILAGPRISAEYIPAKSQPFDARTDPLPSPVRSHCPSPIRRHEMRGDSAYRSFRN